MPTREWNLDVLRYFLRKLPVDELVDSLITVIESVVGDDDKALKDISHLIVTNIQAREIIAGRSKLESYTEPHRGELKKYIDEINASMKGKSK
jgi:hypothetical protein